MLPADHSLPETQPNDRTASRAALVLLGAAIIVDVFYLNLAFITNAWQMYALTGVIFAFVILALVSQRIIGQGRFGLGGWLLIGGMLVVFPVASLLIADVGLVLGLSLAFLVITIAPLILPPKQINWAVVSGIGVGLATYGVDTLALAYRLPVPEIQTFVPVITLVIVLIYAVFLARQFPNYSLRTKLIVGFIAVSVLSVVAVTVTTALIVRPQLEQDIADNLQSLSRSQAAAVGNLLARQIEALDNLASSSPLVIEVKFANDTYADGPEEPDRETILAQIRALDTQWQAAEDTDRLLQSRLIGGRTFELNQFQQFFPHHEELFITDKYGALVAATRRTPRFYYGDQAWWQAASNGELYIGQPEFYENAQSYGLVLAVPIRAFETQEVVGILHSRFRLEAIADVLTAVRLGNLGGVDLYFNDGQILYGHQHQETTPTLQPAPARLNNDPFTRLDPDVVPYLEMEYDGVPNMVGQAQVTTFTGEPFVDRLNWRIIVHQNRDAALAPVTQQTDTNLRIALLVAVGAALGAVFVSQRLSRPIIRLTEVAQQITGGNLNIEVPVETQDEIGTLGEAFNTMTNRLQQTISTLEDQVAARTQQLETVVGVGRRLSGILDLSDLMREVVTLTKENFNYYHVHIYLLDEPGETLMMAEGYGQAGAEMKRRGHNIALSAAKSLVAQAAREAHIITVENVRDDPTWLPNPLLPDTQSEMAVPVMLGSEVVGVLDVQSEKVGGLTDTDKTTLQALADQVAVAVRNARQFAQTQEKLYEAERLQRLYTGDAWERFSQKQTKTEYEVRQSAAGLLEQVNTPEAMIALQQQETVDLNQITAMRDSMQESSDGADKKGQPPDTKANRVAALATPLKLRGEIIGVLGIQDTNPQRQWTEDEISLIEAVTEQMSLALENARLFEETQRNAWRDRVVSESTAEVWSSAEIEEVMRNAVAQLGDKLQASEVIIRLGTAADEPLENKGSE